LALVLLDFKIKDLEAFPVSQIKERNLIKEVEPSKLSDLAFQKI
jgi:hypothetical protein